ncbi:uncharacterized protein LOC123625976 [Lemur catta]|uniref:uncharacterized protein LOC123625976 n=1 Tax=Lemur catta TaxID=9447 RepID=UPI001E26B579|nr:uncharacterized protein LOC123625976 [Lemur catta]
MRAHAGARSCMYIYVLVCCVTCPSTPAGTLWRPLTYTQAVYGDVPSRPGATWQAGAGELCCCPRPGPAGPETRCAEDTRAGPAASPTPRTLRAPGGLLTLSASKCGSMTPVVPARSFSSRALATPSPTRCRGSRSPAPVQVPDHSPLGHTSQHALQAKNGRGRSPIPEPLLTPSPALPEGLWVPECSRGGRPGSSGTQEGTELGATEDFQEAKASKLRPWLSFARAAAWIMLSLTSGGPEAWLPLTSLDLCPCWALCLQQHHPDPFQLRSVFRLGLSCPLSGEPLITQSRDCQFSRLSPLD